jgi:uncharacterized protein YodC (DUF2158 family)
MENKEIKEGDVVYLNSHRGHEMTVQDILENGKARCCWIKDENVVRDTFPKIVLTFVPKTRI